MGPVTSSRAGALTCRLRRCNIKRKKKKRYEGKRTGRVSFLGRFGNVNKKKKRNGGGQKKKNTTSDRGEGRTLIRTKNGREKPTRENGSRGTHHHSRKTNRDWIPRNSSREEIPS